MTTRPVMKHGQQPQPASQPIEIFSPRNPGSWSSFVRRLPRKYRCRGSAVWSRISISPATTYLSMSHLISSPLLSSNVGWSSAALHCTALPTANLLAPCRRDASWFWDPSLKMAGGSMCSHGRGFLGEFWVGCTCAGGIVLR